MEITTQPKLLLSSTVSEIFYTNLTRFYNVAHLFYIYYIVFLVNKVCLILTACKYSVMTFWKNAYFFITLNHYKIYCKCDKSI
jgi:hypothetical protein